LFIREFLYWFHEEESGLFEILSVPVRELALFVLSDFLNGPEDLTNDMVSVSYNSGLFEAGIGNIPKMRIHITNKVFNFCFGGEL